jgi:hypothetical protein
MELEELKYPIGKYQHPALVDLAIRKDWEQRIAALPYRLEAAVSHLDNSQLDTPYRPGGWTLRQLVHHIADSHQNAHCRIRMMLTEHQPIIKPYDQDAWVNLPYIQTLPLQASLDILRGLHARWAALLATLPIEDFQRIYVHPEYGKSYTLEYVTGMYAWHGDHHLAHILGLKERQGWA